MMRFKFIRHFLQTFSILFTGKGGNEFAEEVADALHVAYDNRFALKNFEK